MSSTPSQTVGPFLAVGLLWDRGPVADPQGVRVYGRLLDGAGDPVTDGLIEVWSPEPPAFARCPTGDDGAWSVLVPSTAYLSVHVFARGLLRHLTTRICLDQEAIPDGVPPDRRDTLLPEHTDDGWRFDIRIQGDHETVFFDL
jgi:protocatechuate 3,4-dioxygenase alpha subunit